mmetsp:Transcript_10683/g.23639  ORF Transcript_10683/g.23639 Transcript_10683/m.23639 type:complete len:470 (+) Transcript_10683:237-1646(+)|eukprot:CAMPEP_0172313316 /NCGR_PEP_ID=MMETSP1058-20130122/20020_1 /TAXON_ID=83371 /ORGANISM="Detonula confervacea, Strain CCMP 353" /LENGTH=469 /DNA_ID=CAMNT_0013026955 /DNA_START=132 /DNA_END=1541 /DNA_ORIENTATION=-
MKSSSSTKDVGKRLLDLERDLMATRRPSNVYNGNASIKKLQGYAGEANECLEQYSHCDNGEIPEQYTMLAYQRSIAGLPSIPPSQMKVVAWSMVKIAKLTLAEAYEEKKKEEAVEVYESLVDHCMRARVEIWEGEAEIHRIMSNLGLCLKRFGRYEEAADWYTKADQMCVTEDPDSEVHKQIKHNISVMLAGKAGAATFSGEDGTSRKGWKRCWGCNAKESDTVIMLRCQKCIDVGHATPAYYCCRKCQVEDWPRHKVFHKSMKKRAKQSTSIIKEEDLAALSSDGADDDNTYMGMIRKSCQCTLQNDMKGARRWLEKAIKLDPENPLAHHNIATGFSNSGHYSGAVLEYIETVKLIETGDLMYDPYMEMWARSVVSTHAIYRDYGGAVVSIPKPKFLVNKELMLKCAKQASEVVPSYNECWAMLANLAEHKGDLGESKKFYEKAANKSENQANRAKYRREAKRIEELM